MSRGAHRHRNTARLCLAVGGAAASLVATVLTACWIVLFGASAWGLALWPVAFTAALVPAMMAMARFTGSDEVRAALARFAKADR